MLCRWPLTAERGRTCIDKGGAGRTPQRAILFSRTMTKRGGGADGSGLMPELVVENFEWGLGSFIGGVGL